MKIYKDGLKNQDGLASALLLIVSLIILALAVIFCLDVLEIIDVPKEYSLTRFLDTYTETVYQAESSEQGDRTNIVKKKKSSGNSSSSGAELVVTKPVESLNEDGSDYTEFKDDFNYKRFYYMQLADDSKMIYDAIIDNLDGIKTGTYTLDFGKSFNELLNTEGGDEILNSYFQSAVNAILLDNPEIFFLDITKMYLLTKSTTYPLLGTTYEVSIGPSNGESYLGNGFTESSLKQAESELKSAKRTITKIAKGSNLEKIKIVHDYLVDNLDYDSSFSNKNIYNVYGGLVNNITVCEGYAKSFKTIMDDLDIPCVVVCGIAQNSKGDVENHAWNYVELNGKWYAIDVTWDDPIVVGGGNLSEESKYKYYLRGANALFADHEEDGKVVEGANFAYPKLNKEDY